MGLQCTKFFLCLFLLIFSQFWSFGTFSVGFFVPLIYPIFLEYHLIYHYYEMLRGHLVYFLSCLQNKPFLKRSSGYFYWKVVIKNKIWALGLKSKCTHTRIKWSLVQYDWCPYKQKRYGYTERRKSVLMYSLFSH